MQRYRISCFDTGQNQATGTIEADSVRLHKLLKAGLWLICFDANSHRGEHMPAKWVAGIGPVGEATMVLLPYVKRV